MMKAFREGQRWISESEPELGLGTVVKAGGEQVSILFPASGELRQYAAEHAPLKRVRFRAGDTIRSHEGRDLAVVEAREEEGLITYAGEGWELPEAKLSDHISFNRPEDRLLSGQVDEGADFELRRRTLGYLHRCRKSAVRGFVGGRIDLIPHQLYIAHEVSSRHAPRVLLSDEVGLGKTIEACLILHRLLLSGRAARVLILVPESLVHQWFVEMLRRFHIWLHIFDEERCASIEAGQPEVNPFLDDQLILCSVGFLAESERRAAQAREAGWDVLVVDEAHHLEWAPDRVSREYALVEQLGRQSEGLLLLTATPEQLGQESHFARLRLLDPDRYTDFDAFKREAVGYEAIAKLAEKLVQGRKLTRTDGAHLKKVFSHDTEGVAARVAAIAAGDEAERTRLLEDLLDLHGPGRVVFRNTRSAMSGFPRRRVRMAPLRARTDHEHWVEEASMEFAEDAGDAQLRSSVDLAKDPRVEWLAGLVRELEPGKVLVICRSREKVLALEEALRQQINVKAGIFHEELTLVQRDRNAAWFAEEDGARMLICSEIGSEGRNFQFAHHLVLFDLPLNPELLEQRIGRLDRIGQTEDVHIHVPYLEGSPQEVLSRWYQDGLDAFESNLEGGNELLRIFGRQVHDLALEYPALDRASDELDALVRETADARKQLRRRLELGRDRLLEMNSFRAGAAGKLVDAIRAEDNDPALEEYMLDVFDRFGVRVEELGPSTFHVDAAGAITDAFPSVPREGMVVIFDRVRALGREDVGFLSWDHPMVAGAMDLILGSEKGNSAFAVWEGPDRVLLLECWFVLETVAPGRLHADRFLPTTPLRVVVNHKPSDVTAEVPEAVLGKVLVKGTPYRFIDHPEIAQKVIPAMVAKASELAERQSQALVKESFGVMSRMLTHELERLRSLQQVNDHVRPAEIQLAERQLDDLAKAIKAARVRLDSVRLIWKGPHE